MFVKGPEDAPVSHGEDIYIPHDGVLDVPRDLGEILCRRHGYYEVEPPVRRRPADGFYGRGVVGNSDSINAPGRRRAARS